MCGRYSLTTPLEALRRLFGFDSGLNLRPRYNIAPTQDVLIVRSDEADGMRAELAHWGLIPHWAKDRSMASRMINARSETVAEKPAFRSAFRRQRCLIPADGFYEWQAVPGQRRKQPYRLHLAEDEPFAFAGLWSRWAAPAGDDVLSCTILTAEATANIAAIHPRMPVIVRPAGHAAWLDPAATPHVGAIERLDGADLRTYAIDPRVGSVKNDDTAIWQPAASPEASLL